jgi:hypothetical protein
VRRTNQSSGGRRGPLVAPASYEHFPPSQADSVFTRRRTVRARAFVKPHIALLRRISGIARRVLAIILCSGLVHAFIPALGLRSIKLCAFLLLAIAALLWILHLSSRRRGRCACDKLECDNHSDQNARGHRSLASLRFPQCGLLRFGSNSTGLCRLIACIMSIRASIVGPPRSAININAFIAARHSDASCSAFGSFVM